MSRFNPYPSDWRTKRDASLQNALSNFAVIQQMGNYSLKPDPEYDYLSQAENNAFQANKVRSTAALQRLTSSYPVANSGSSTPKPKALKTGNVKLDAFIRAISGQESGGNYGARNSSSGAMGKYQIMPGNIAGPGGWDKEVLGKNISTQQFMSSPKLQEAIAKGKLTQYYKKYGAAGAASAWYSGSPNKWNSRTPQGSYPSIHNYVLSILRRAGLG